MGNINDLKKRLKSDPEFKKLFTDKKDMNELIKTAHENGYDISKEDLEKDEELSEDALEAVAGGRNKKNKKVEINEVDVYF